MTHREKNRFFKEGSKEKEKVNTSSCTAPNGLFKYMIHLYISLSLSTRPCPKPFYTHIFVFMQRNTKRSVAGRGMQLKIQHLCQKKELCSRNKKVKNKFEPFDFIFKKIDQTFSKLTFSLTLQRKILDFVLCIMRERLVRSR